MDHLAVPELALGSYERWTGLRVCVHDLLGDLAPAIDPARVMHSGPFCAVAKRSPHAWRCPAFDVDQLRPRLASLSEGRIHRCHAGLVELVVPVLEDGEPLAVLFAGQRLASGWTPDYSAPPSGVPLPKGVPSVSAEQAQQYLEGLRQLAARLRLWLRERSAPRGEPSRAVRIRRLIQERHDQPLRLADVAGHLGVSPSRAAHLVREETGESWTSLLTAARLATACRLLHHTDLPVTEVALRSGFGDQAHFHRVFRRHFATTPHRYRKDPEAHAQHAPSPAEQAR